MKALKIFTAAVILLFAPLAQASEDILGDWHGVLKAPQGNLTLVITITEGPDGGLLAEMESPDQAPGQKIPIGAITFDEQTLSFSIQALRASYTGKWLADEDRFEGVFNQGLDMELNLVRGLPEAKPAFEGLDGLWEGTVSRNGVDLRLVLRVHTDENGTIPVFDAPDFGAFGLPVENFNKTGSKIGFSIPGAQARFEGEIANGNTWAGTWTAANQPEAEVTFTRTRETTERKELNRPQEPEEPYGYKVEEVSFANPEAEGVTLAGTLTLPKGDGPFPAAVLITGSGPQDRDESLLGHKPFFVLADFLSKNGIAVLRYDDRGIDGSTGDFWTATSKDFASDANAAAAFLKTRTEIKPTAIGLVGHSEGGLVAPISAVQNGGVAYIVLLAGPGTNMDHLLLAQQRLTGTATGRTHEELDEIEAITVEIYAAIRAARGPGDLKERVNAVLTPENLKTLGGTEDQREFVVHQLTTPWILYLLNYEPETFLSRVKVPVLAINGSLDLQVPADENLAAIREALANNPDTTVLKLEGLNHLFQTAETGAFGEYRDIEETFAPSAMELVADWINERF